MKTKYKERSLLGGIAVSGTSKPTVRGKQPTDPNRTNYAYYAGASALGHGIAGYFEGRAQKRVLQSQANSSLAQAQAYELNAQLAHNEIGNAYKEGAYRAMVQGLEDARAIAHQRARTGSSGVQIGSGSAKEIEASQMLNAAINQYVLQQTTTSAANRARISEGNALAQAIQARGDAEASSILSKGVSPVLSGLTSILGAAAMYDMQWQMNGNNSMFSGLFSRG